MQPATGTGIIFFYFFCSNLAHTSRIVQILYLYIFVTFFKCVIFSINFCKYFNWVNNYFSDNSIY